MDRNVIIGVILLIAIIYLFISEKLPAYVTAMLGATAFAVLGIMPYKDAYIGFGSDIIMLIAGSMVLGGVLFETGLADIIGEKIVKVFGGSEKKLLVAVIFASAILSAFLSNTATVAMFIPIITAAAAQSHGKIQSKNIIMALGFAAVAGGSCTLVGSTTQMIAQGLLADGGYRTMKFFDLAIAGAPKIFLMMLYFATLGYAIQKKTFNFPDKAIAMESVVPENATKPKMWISGIILILCIVAFVSQIWTIGTVAIAGALLCIITGCISPKKALSYVELNNIIMVAGVLGFAKGLEASGAGNILANGVVKILGDAPSEWTLLFIIIGIATVCGNLFSHTAAVGILTPISIMIAKSLGIDPFPLVYGIVSGINVAYLTPIATPPITMTLVGGYRFKDYTKVGWPLTIAAYLITVLIIGLVF